MGLSCSQISLLMYTARKADIENSLTAMSNEKMAVTREISQLSTEYNNKLQAKQLAYYNNGQYNKVNYGYFMGYGSNYTEILNDSGRLKNDNSMILVDYRGQVVMSDAYANAMKTALGSSILDSSGRGKTFSKDKIPEILAALLPGFTASDFQTVIDNESVDSSYDATTQNAVSGETTGSTTVDNSDTRTAKIQQLLDFYYPIFTSAATNGWTTEYNNQLSSNDNYVNDALQSGIFQLADTNDNGDYLEDTSLTYFITAGEVETVSDSATREEITAWYNKQKAVLEEKEAMIDLMMNDESTELQAINSIIKSLESFINDAITSVFNWGNSK